ncbi:uncharacterized protein LOC101462735 [Ceratitis capitata]|uniref:uncharacterized protein LOC101462735 n=1 Tax=Ceratitis capitata TaxID=7213 RepID=UPI0003296A09|nr:uncharacterized protein LOC101462735 [Ceratitis capitata]
MNYNRRRNIFTLGDFHQYPNPTQQIKAQQNRRQSSDPFERDPFKIQSYNFRYAERPSYPLPNLYNSRVQPASSSSNKRFETFFYNYDFTPSVHDKENPPAHKFREFRRRKFLLDHQHQQQHQTTPFVHVPTVNSRESSSFQQTNTTTTNNNNSNHMCQQQQLHPIVNATIRIGTSASQTAITSSAGAAGAARAASRPSSTRIEYERTHADDDGCGVARHHQATRCSATDTSSVATAAGLRYGRDNVSISSHMPSLNKSGRKTHARSTGNREYLRALATAHINESANQSNFFGRGHGGSSRTSIERGRRSRFERLGNGYTLTNGNNIFGRMQSGELSSSGTSPTKYVGQPVQNVHSVSPNRVTATVEKTEGTCSGCQININIKGLDSTQLGDNVVIKIESDKMSPNKTNSKAEQHAPVISTLNNIYSATGSAQHRNDIAIAKLVEIKRNSDMSHNLDNKPKASTHQQPQAMRNSSSSSFVIDKRLSKFALNSTDEPRKHRPRSSSYSRIPITSSTTRAMGFNTSNSAVRSSNSTEGISRVPKSVSKERMPSMVPWCLDTTLRRGFSHDEDDTKPPQPMKPTRPSYDSTLNDVRKMRRQAVVAAYKPFSLQRTSVGSSLRPRKSESFHGGSKQATNNDTCKPIDKTYFKKSNGNWNTDSVRHNASHHSLRAVRPSRGTLRSQSSSQLELKHSPTMIMHRSRSSIRPTAQHPTDSQSHVSVKTTPLNVNINVFADKLKLLRV